MSALPPNSGAKGDIAGVREVPIGELSRCSNVHLLNHRVGAGKEARRNFNPEGPGGDQIDDEIELSGLLDWKLCGFRPAQDLVHIIGGSAEEVDEARSVRHQPANIDML